MNWTQIIGQEKVKQQLVQSIQEHRISHAQLFVSTEGSGALQLAIAYAKAVLNLNQQQHAILENPDLYFSFPVATTDNVKKEPTSNLFMKEWRRFLQEQPYGNLNHWLQFLGVEKKQGNINVLEAQNIIKFLNLNSFAGGYKVVIIWLPEQMNQATANKLLKVIEEPPKNSLFLLVTEQAEQLLPTIVSRCQSIKIPKLTREQIANHLHANYDLEQTDALHIAHTAQGNMRVALELVENQQNQFESFFVQWVRNAFMAKKNPSVLKHLVEWTSEISAWNREEQKQFLNYCSEIFRQALIANYQASELVFLTITQNNFKWEQFASYIHGANIPNILEELNTAFYHIERNANAKILFLDLSINLTRHLHKKTT